MSHDPETIDQDALRAAASFSTATLHEAAGQRGALPAAIKPLVPGRGLAGVAFTVASAPLDNLWIHRGLAVAPADAILIVSVEGAYEAGYWGDIMTKAAMARRLGGLVIDGCVRDRRELAASEFPVFARGLCIRGTAKVAGTAGGVGAPLRIGETDVRAGDVVIGDDDGVVVLPREDLPAIVHAAAARVDREADVARQVASGRSTLEIYGWE